MIKANIDHFFYSPAFCNTAQHGYDFASQNNGYDIHEILCEFDSLIGEDRYIFLTRNINTCALSIIVITNIVVKGTQHCHTMTMLHVDNVTFG